MVSSPVDRSHIPLEIQREIEVFAVEVERLRRAQVSEENFRHFRLQHGIYGQRQSGVQMVRVKVPFGGLRTEHLEQLAEIADTYSKGIAHVTTRQDFQLHWVKLDNVPELMWKLAEVGLTTREACGNTVRNVTACPYSGICRDEVFDVTPYARAVSRHFLRNPVCQHLGRKFKIAFSGCSQHACGLAQMHDIGAVAVVNEEGGVNKRGFQVYVGGGLGSAPHQAKLFSDFVPVEEIIPLYEAILRIFNQMGERRNRNKARMKFLVAKLGIEEFRRVVLEERASIDVDPAWNAYLADAELGETPPSMAGGTINTNGHARSPEYLRWRVTNVKPQKQAGYSAVTIALPLGDITSDQLRALAQIARQFVGDHLRTTVQQNILLRWVREEDLPALHQSLGEVGLAEAGAETLIDVVACPGADTCNLGITSSRGLARAIRQEFSEENGGVGEDLKDIKIKISGCPNSCGQHHVANIGFFGSSRRIGDHVSPHYQLIIGGEAKGNAMSYGLATVKVPSKNVPATVKRLTEFYRKERVSEETFNAFVGRIGKERVREIIADLLEVPVYGEVPDHYIDWSQENEFSLKDIGVGECAGQLVELVQLRFDEANRDIFESNLLLEKSGHREAIDRAEHAMVHAAGALLATQGVKQKEREQTLAEFEERFIKTGLVSPMFAKFAHRAEHVDETNPTWDLGRLRIEEAVLFIEECQSAYSRMKITDTPSKAAPVHESEILPTAPVEEIVDSLDLKGVECPFNYVQTKLRLETMEVGQLLEITIDDGEPYRNVPQSLRNDGQEIVDVKKTGTAYRLVIRKKV